MATNIPEFNKRDFTIKRRGLSLATREILKSHPEVARALDKGLERREFDKAVLKAYESHKGSYALNPTLRHKKILRQAIAEGKFLKGDSISAKEAREIQSALGIKKALRRSEMGEKGSTIKDLPGEAPNRSSRFSRSGTSGLSPSSPLPIRPRF
jgi:hypothetical protein